jgi:hypothetical protein
MNSGFSFWVTLVSGPPTDPRGTEAYWSSLLSLIRRMGKNLRHKSQNFSKLERPESGGHHWRIVCKEVTSFTPTDKRITSNDALGRFGTRRRLATEEVAPMRPYTKTAPHEIKNLHSGCPWVIPPRRTPA